MFAYINGILEYVSEDNCVLDVQGIGYNIKISGETAARLPGIGEPVKLYTYTCVREDAFQLYGFLTRSDLEIYKKQESFPEAGHGTCQFHIFSSEYS